MILLPLLLIVLFSLMLSGCTGSPSMLAPASPEAAQINGLFWGVMGVAAVIFFVVEGLLIFAVLRFRSRPGAPEPDQVHGNLRFEIAWSLAPALVLVGIFAATVQTMTAVSEQQSGALRVRATGNQWWWQFSYLDLGIATATELRVPVGQPVEVELVAGDVIHSFWAPELFGKTDTIPGRSTWARFTATKAGVYRGQCAEFCGVQHANMGFLVVAESPGDFDDWVKQRWSATKLAESRSPNGAQAFAAGACLGCHTIDGTQALGKLGPDLTLFGRRRTIAALTLENTPENLSAWLANPQTVKPGAKMPSLGLNEQTIQDLVAYLETLK